MRIQRGLLALFAVALLTIAACSSTPAGVSSGSVKTAIEGAAKITLVDQTASVGAGAPSGTTILTNIPTATTDLQVVAVFVADTAANAKVASDAMTASLSGLGAGKVYSNKNVVVYYAALGGTDNSAAVEAAVKGL